MSESKARHAGRRPAARSRVDRTPAGQCSVAPARGTGRSNRALQAKLTVGRQDDPLEREADRAAERVLAGETVGTLGTADPGAQRKCASCEAEDSDTLRRQPIEEEEELLQPKSGSGGARLGGADAAAAAVRTGGHPLSAAERGYFEPRFGRDFSAVRIHDDPRAQSAAAAINARAFTLGAHIAVSAGGYSPASRDGRRLFAHELAHVAQQGRAATDSAPTIRKAPKPDTSGGGGTAFEEKVPKKPKMQGGEWVGDVERSEFVPAKGKTPRQEVHSGTVRVHFDPTACEITIPYRLAFRQRQTARQAENCQGPPTPPAPAQKLSGNEMTNLKKRYIDAQNSGLNGWYTADLTDCEHACVGKTIPIRVEVSEDAGNPDRRIDVVNRGGRPDGSTICAPDYYRDSAIHEGGHQVLRHGDEYRESDPKVRQRDPERTRDERVRHDDWSRMRSSVRFGRFALFHERHFAFVPAFLEAALGDCSASLEEVRRPLLLDFRPSASVGYVYSGGHGYSLGVGFDIGLPLDRQRDWQILLGAHGRLLTTLGEGERSAWMAGARFGLERNFTPSSGGARIGAFAELGGGNFREGPAYAPTRQFGFAYGEAGLQFGYRSPRKREAAFTFGAEVAGGAAFQPGRGIIGEPGGEIERPESFRWFRAGVNVGLLF